eukprot:gene1257-32607_t
MAEKRTLGERKEGWAHAGAWVKSTVRHSSTQLDRLAVRGVNFINAWLTLRQEKALLAYRTCFDLQPKSHWAKEELCDASEGELKEIETMMARLETDGHLATEKCKEYCSDLTVLNYLRARDHHLDRAHQMLEHSLKWRSEKEPWTFENVASRTDKMVSDARIVGYDMQGRVVVYSSFAKTTKRVPAEVTVNTAAMMNHFGSRHKNGFNFWDTNPQFALAGANVFGHHYPECLKVMIIVDPPSIFMGLWKAVKPMLPEKTRNKVSNPK